MSLQIHVVVGKNGSIVGTYRPPAKRIEGGPIAMPMAARGQKVHVLEIEPDVHALKDTDELHRRIAEMIAKKAV